MRKNALRIALLTHSVNPRGVVHTLGLASALSAQGDDVTVFAPATNGETLFRTPPCRVVYALVTDSQAGTVALVDARIRALKRSVRAHSPAAFEVLRAEDSISGNALAELTISAALLPVIRGDSATNSAHAAPRLRARFSWDDSARRHVNAYRAWLAHPAYDIH
ncbi:MAG: hypothetical protein QOH33_628 [Paraburkholderia sp.]|nr:hypothetical protein [Paraburkholderia sp.]